MRASSSSIERLTWTPSRPLAGHLIEQKTPAQSALHRRTITESTTTAPVYASVARRIAQLRQAHLAPDRTNRPAHSRLGIGERVTVMAPIVRGRKASSGDARQLDRQGFRPRGWRVDGPVDRFR